MSAFAALSLLIAAQAEPASHAIPFAVPIDHSFIIEHRDTRMLAEGGTATFQERSQVSFVAVDGALIASSRSLGRACDGPTAICDAFSRLGSRVDGRVFRFRIGLADRSVTLLDAVTLPADAPVDETATQVAAAVAQSEAAAPGALLAADLRQLIRFAGTVLPTIGTAVAFPEGTVRLTALAGPHAILAIERETRMSDTVVLNGSGECQISRLTGLAETCRFVDWTGQDRTRPMRIREMRLTLAPAAVS